MKNLIAEIPDALHMELKLASLEDDQTIKFFINELLWVTLLTRLKDKSKTVENDKQLNDIIERMKKLRTMRHDEAQSIIAQSITRVGKNE